MSSALATSGSAIWRTPVCSTARATLVDSQGWYNWNELGVLLDRMGEYEEATSALEKARDLAPQGVFTPTRNLGSVRIHQGDVEGALELFEQVPGPTRNGTLASNIATAYFFSDRDDRLEKAEQYYRLAARLEPALAEIHGNLADVLSIRSKNEEAKKHYQIALELVENSLELEQIQSSSFHQLRLARATYAAKAGLCPRALEEAIQLIPLVPQTAGDHHRLAYPLALCGAEERAIDALERAVELGFSTELIAMESEFSGLAESERFAVLVTNK